MHPHIIYNGICQRKKVKPKYKLKYRLFRYLTKTLIHSIMWTCRIEIKNRQLVDDLMGKHSSLIYVFWHRHIFYTIYHFRNRGARPLISLSEDGELVTHTALGFGMNPIRGSSSKGGARAFMEMVKEVQKPGQEILITADGPKGPPRLIKDGPIKLSQKSRIPLVPISWNCNRPKIFKKSWDQFMIPRPFSRVVFSYGEAWIPPENKLTAEELEASRNQINTSLNDLEAASCDPER